MRRLRGFDGFAGLGQGKKEQVSGVGNQQAEMRIESLYNRIFINLVEKVQLYKKFIGNRPVRDKFLTYPVHCSALRDPK